LRRSITLEPGQRARVCLVLAAGSSRDQVLLLMDKYSDPYAAERAMDFAWRSTQQQLQVLHIQPDEGISLQFGAKIPGAHVQVGSVTMDFQYSDYFGTEPSTGYERLLYDCMIGDATLFQRADMVEAGWSVVEPVLDVWRALPARTFPNYVAGSWGPKEADDLMKRDGRHWRNE